MSVVVKTKVQFYSKNWHFN